MKVKYIGPHTEVEIAASGDVVKRGETATVSKELGESLCLQEDNWKAVGDDTRAGKAKASAAATDTTKENS